MSTLKKTRSRSSSKRKLKRKKSSKKSLGVNSPEAVENKDTIDTVVDAVDSGESLDDVGAISTPVLDADSPAVTSEAKDAIIEPDAKTQPQQLQTIELFFNGKSLHNADYGMGNKSDPYLKCFVGDKLVATTEVIGNNLNPYWKKRVVLDYTADTVLRVEVWDKDFRVKGFGPDDDFLGMTSFKVAEVVTEPGQTASFQLEADPGSLAHLERLRTKSPKKSNSKVKQAATWFKDKGKEWTAERLQKRIESIRASRIAVRAEVATKNTDVVVFAIQGQNLAACDRAVPGIKAPSSDPYLTFERQRPDAKGDELPVWVHKTEIKMENLNPEWEVFALSVAALCNGDYSRPLNIKCWDYDSPFKKIPPSRKDDLIGELTVSLQELLSGPSTRPLTKKDRGNRGQLVFRALGVLQASPLTSFFPLDGQQERGGAQVMEEVLDTVQADCDGNLFMKPGQRLKELLYLKQQLKDFYLKAPILHQGYHDVQRIASAAFRKLLAEATSCLNEEQYTALGQCLVSIDNCMRFVEQKHLPAEFMGYVTAKDLVVMKAEKKSQEMSAGSLDALKRMANAIDPQLIPKVSQVYEQTRQALSEQFRQHLTKSKELLAELKKGPQPKDAAYIYVGARQQTPLERAVSSARAVCIRGEWGNQMLETLQKLRGFCKFDEHCLTDEKQLLYSHHYQQVTSELSSFLQQQQGVALQALSEVPALQAGDHAVEEKAHQLGLKMRDPICCISACANAPDMLSYLQFSPQISQQLGTVKAEALDFALSSLLDRNMSAGLASALWQLAALCGADAALGAGVKDVLVADLDQIQWDLIAVVIRCEERLKFELGRLSQQAISEMEAFLLQLDASQPLRPFLSERRRMDKEQAELSTQLQTLLDQLNISLLEHLASNNMATLIKELEKFACLARLSQKRQDFSASSPFNLFLQQLQARMQAMKSSLGDSLSVVNGAPGDIQRAVANLQDAVQSSRCVLPILSALAEGNKEAKAQSDEDTTQGGADEGQQGWSQLENEWKSRVASVCDENSKLLHGVEERLSRTLEGIKKYVDLDAVSENGEESKQQLTAEAVCELKDGWIFLKAMRWLDAPEYAAPDLSLVGGRFGALLAGLEQRLIQLCLVLYERTKSAINGGGDGDPDALLEVFKGFLPLEHELSNFSVRKKWELLQQLKGTFSKEDDLNVALEDGNWSEVLKIVKAYKGKSAHRDKAESSVMNHLEKVQEEALLSLRTVTMAVQTVERNPSAFDGRNVTALVSSLAAFAKAEKSLASSVSDRNKLKELKAEVSTALASLATTLQSAIQSDQANLALPALEVHCAIAHMLSDPVLAVYSIPVQPLNPASVSGQLEKDTVEAMTALAKSVDEGSGEGAAEGKCLNQLNKVYAAAAEVELFVSASSQSGRLPVRGLDGLDWAALRSRLQQLVAQRLVPLEQQVETLLKQNDFQTALAQLRLLRVLQGAVICDSLGLSERHNRLCQNIEKARKTFQNTALVFEAKSAQPLRDFLEQNSNDSADFVLQQVKEERFADEVDKWTRFPRLKEILDDLSAYITVLQDSKAENVRALLRELEKEYSTYREAVTNKFQATLEQMEKEAKQSQQVNPLGLETLQSSFDLLANHLLPPSPQNRVSALVGQAKGFKERLSKAAAFVKQVNPAEVKLDPKELGAALAALQTAKANGQELPHPDTCDELIRQLATAFTQAENTEAWLRANPPRTDTVLLYWNNVQTLKRASSDQELRQYNAEVVSTAVRAWLEELIEQMSGMFARSSWVELESAWDKLQQAEQAFLPVGLLRGSSASEEVRRRLQQQLAAQVESFRTAHGLANKPSVRDLTEFLVQLWDIRSKVLDEPFQSAAAALADKLIYVYLDIRSKVLDEPFQSAAAALADKLIAFYTDVDFALSLTELGAMLNDSGELGIGVWQTSKQFQAQRIRQFQQDTTAVTIESTFKYMLEKEDVIKRRNNKTFCEIDAKRIQTAYESYQDAFLGPETTDKGTGLKMRRGGHLSKLVGRKGCTKCSAVAREEAKLEEAEKCADMSDPALKLGPCVFCSLVQSVLDDCNKLKEKKFAGVAEAIPDILARVFAVWSTSLSVKGAKDVEELLRPHTVQIVTLLRLLGLDSSKTRQKEVAASSKHALLQALGMQNHLAEVITGGGKSVILGGMATVLALLGCRVNCVCYSSYLSQRDAKAFLPLWELFQVEGLVMYSTLGELVDKMMNESGSIREQTEAFLFAKTNTNADPGAAAATGPRILMIDEADVFFGKDFYGNSYNAGVTLKEREIQALMQYIWEQQQNKPTLRQLQQRPEYQDFVSKNRRCEQYLDLGLQQMLCDVSEYNNPPYRLHNGLIGYEEGEGISTKKIHGYRTMFAYLHEHERGNVSKATLGQMIGLAVNCGAYSYAKIPESFDCILGVTGTLDCMTDYESQIISNYKIYKRTYTPSIYTESRVSQDGLYENKNLKVEDTQVFETMDGMFQAIKTRIGKLDFGGKGSKPCCVFFESEKILQEFYKAWPSAKVVNIGDDTKIAPKIGQAGSPGTVTLLPSVFGRGTDFQVNDKAVEAAGGMHVIQAFFADALSEEAQIKGRTARQKKSGSFEILVLAEDAATKFSLTPQQTRALLEIKESKALYQSLSQYRREKAAREDQTRDANLREVTFYHEKSTRFLDSLRLHFTPRNNADVEKALSHSLWEVQFLRQPAFHWLLVLDRSGSMVTNDILPRDTARYTSNRMGALHEAVAAFLTGRSHHPNDRFSVVVFDHETQTVFRRIAPQISWQASLDQIIAAKPRQGYTDYKKAWQDGKNGVMDLLKEGTESTLQVSGVKVLFLSDGTPMPPVAESNLPEPQRVQLIQQWINTSIQPGLTAYKAMQMTDAGGRPFARNALRDERSMQTMLPPWPRPSVTFPTSRSTCKVHEEPHRSFNVLVGDDQAHRLLRNLIQSLRCISTALALNRTLPSSCTEPLPSRPFTMPSSQPSNNPYSMPSLSNNAISSDQWHCLYIFHCG
eukprot:g29972.t1